MVSEKFFYLNVILNQIFHNYSYNSNISQYYQFHGEKIKTKIHVRMTKHSVKYSSILIPHKVSPSVMNHYYLFISNAIY